MKPLNRDIRFIRNLLILSSVIICLVFASGIFMPIIFSGFIAVFLAPAAQKLETIGLPRSLSVLITVLIATAVVFGLLFVLSYESQKILSSLPGDNIEKMMDESTRKVESSMKSTSINFTKALHSSLNGAKEQLVSALPKILSNASSMLAFFVTCPIYIFFLLMYKSNLRGFYYESMEPHNRKMGKEIILEIEEAFSAYLKGMVIVISIISVLTSLGLWLLGIEYPIFLGVLAGFLSLVPYLGIIVSALVPMALALVTKDSLWYVVGVAGVFTVVQFLEGNIITPRILGSKVDVNPLVIILGLVCFGAVAGITAMIITVPFLALMKITSSKIPTWKPLNKLLEA